jgi:D-serine deaminase-like pyridoxal phosphate-dependent protein
MKDTGYELYREALRGREMPLAFVDLDALETNAGRISGVVESEEKTVRVVSKSVRSVEVLRHILDTSDRFEGVMAFKADEAAFLSEKGFDDVLVAYPVWNEDEIRAACEADAEVTLMVSEDEHVERVAAAASEAEVEDAVPLCVDVDMSVDYPALPHFGVYRSKVRSPDDVLGLASTIEETSGVFLNAVMGYEAQIAGLGGRNPANSSAKNAVVRRLKKRSKDTVVERRGDAVEALKQAGYELGFVNGGGTGSLELTAADPSVTEVAVGSGFYFPHLFDYHEGLDYEPAAGYAVEVTRHPAEDIYTCGGGGYVASGPPGVDKAPKPTLPQGAELTHEGAGEVQTPVMYDGEKELEKGDPVVFRHSKAGEMCERFDSLTLLRTDDEEVLGEVPTYRGEGRCFM